MYLILYFPSPAVLIIIQLHNSLYKCQVVELSISFIIFITMSDGLTKEILELAKLLIPDKSKTRKNLYVCYSDQGWCIRKEREHKADQCYEQKRAAISNAKAALHQGEATAILVYNKYGRIQEIIQ